MGSATGPHAPLHPLKGEGHDIEVHVAREPVFGCHDAPDLSCERWQVGLAGGERPIDPGGELGQGVGNTLLGSQPWPLARENVVVQEIDGHPGPAAGSRAESGGASPSIGVVVGEGVDSTMNPDPCAPALRQLVDTATGEVTEEIADPQVLLARGQQEVAEVVQTTLAGG